MSTFAEAAAEYTGVNNCRRGKHDWKVEGYKSCGCDEAHCSIPVYTCSRCGACDYGENAEADCVRADCVCVS